jgi:DNA-nicking Smr family endonuclease
MTGSGGEPPRRRRGLSDDDKALWDFVTRNVKPARGKPRVGGHAAAATEPEQQAVPTLPTQDRTPPPARVHPRPEASARKPSPAERKPPPHPELVVLERRKARRIARGAEEIEARLDLHGMTQEAAYMALAGFVRRCHAGGLRTVLVITGKGGPRDDTGDAGDATSRPRGVLRRSVPRWLAESDLASLVVSYSKAHLRHGGDGALYVQLRRKG